MVIYEILMFWIHIIIINSVMLHSYSYRLCAIEFLNYTQNLNSKLITILSTYTPLISTSPTLVRIVTILPVNKFETSYVFYIF